MANREEAKSALDKIIKKSRVHMYKPIQIAEILYHHRINKNINLLNLEEYRNASKKWRDEVSIPLLGRKCSSSARFQDDIFNDNAMPPVLINELGKENIRTNGAVEAYIYSRFSKKHDQLSEALEYCEKATASDFSVKRFIDSFWNEPGLKRSLDKIYEIVVYSLFSTIVDALDLKVEVTVDPERYDILGEFEDFAKMVMNIDFSNPTYIQGAKVYRVGVTNAADRGLDMYSNWGPAIQIKHLSLDVELAENIVNSVSSDRVIIVCKQAEKDVIVSLLTQIGWRSHIQSIITENNLISWYEKALRGKYSTIMGNALLDTLRLEIAEEFPSIDETPDILLLRNYDYNSDSFWKADNNLYEDNTIDEE